MAFARRRGPLDEEQNRQARSTDLNPEEEEEEEEGDDLLSSSRRRGGDPRRPRALFGAPSDLSRDSKGHLEQPHQFLHVVDHDKFRAGHHRGNLDHHIQDVQQHHGYSHKEEVGLEGAGEKLWPLTATAFHKSRSGQLATSSKVSAPNFSVTQRIIEMKTQIGTTKPPSLLLPSSFPEEDPL